MMSALDFRNRMRHGAKFDVERADLKAAAEFDDIDRDFRRARFARALGGDHGGGKGRRVKRDLQLRPQIENGAVVILMRMRDDHAGDVLALGDQIFDVGENQVDARQMFFLREGNAEIDRQPFARALRPEPVDRQVHADLADAAERREYQFLFSFSHQFPNPNTSPAVTVVTPADPRTNRRPASSSPSKFPLNSRSGSRTLIAWPRPAARLSQSARIAAKPSPACHCDSRFCMAPASALSNVCGATCAPQAARSVAG